MASTTAESTILEEDDAKADFTTSTDGEDVLDLDLDLEECAITVSRQKKEVMDDEIRAIRNTRALIFVRNSILLILFALLVWGITSLVNFAPEKGQDDV